jgi:hypothetical protein
MRTIRKSLPLLFVMVCLCGASASVHTAAVRGYSPSATQSAAPAGETATASWARLLEKQLGTSGLDARLKPSAIAGARQRVWKAWVELNRHADAEPLGTPAALNVPYVGRWTLPDSLEHGTMPFYYGFKGTRPDGGYPLFIYLHGSGAKKQEWANGLYFGNHFDDAPCLYFIPQIPNEDHYRWGEQSKQFCYEKLLRLALASGQADANRIYLYGISEGGYGSQRMASFYADYLAAAGPIAGGEPLINAPAENCANIGFSLRTGSYDAGFGRNQLTAITQWAFDSLEAAHPGLYRHWVQLVPGRGHGIDYEKTTPWLKTFLRNPYPKYVCWEDFEMYGRHRTGFYNLVVCRRPSADQRTRYEMTIADNDISLQIDNVTYEALEKEPRWGITIRYAKHFSPATGGRLRLYLSPELVDLNRRVRISVNGREVFQGKVKCSSRDLVMSCATFYDPCRLYPASVTVNY